MGRDVEAVEFTGEDRARFRAKVRRCLDVFAEMLSERDFSFDVRQVGVEIEFNLVDESGEPALRNSEALAAIADEDFQTELGLFNLEVNVPPVPVAGDGLARTAAALRTQLNEAETKASGVGAYLMMIGILPTLRHEHFSRDAISTNPRYHLLSEQILAARGEDIDIRVEGIDLLEATADTIIPEAACTSTQLHLQVTPEEFPASWNAAQCIAGAQVAVGANSPFLLGRRLWHETRIPLFEQATDTRNEELRAQGVRPRVWFGERWITSVFDLFEENSRYFPALLPIVDDEDPVEVLATGGTPTLGELNLHNGSIWRWNRPVYDIADAAPHLRIENRVLPAGPTIIDTLANAALFHGLVTVLAAADRPVWTQLSFEQAEQSFHDAAREGLGAATWWPEVGEVTFRDLLLHTLLPLAASGLEMLGVDGEVVGRLLGVIEQRTSSGQTGAMWMLDAADNLGRVDNPDTLLKLTTRYRAHMHSGEPVHTWPAD